MNNCKEYCSHLLYVLRKAGHYSKVNKPNRFYPLIFVGLFITVGSMSNLMSGVLQLQFRGQAYSFKADYLVQFEGNRAAQLVM